MDGKDIINSIEKEVDTENKMLTHADGPGYNDHSGDNDHNKAA